MSRNTRSSAGVNEWSQQRLCNVLLLSYPRAPAFIARSA